MAKFTADEKIQIVLRYLNGNESYREMGRSICIFSSAVNLAIEKLHLQLLDCV